MSDFYRHFEDRHRGDRELIKQRLRAYLPFIAPLRQAGGEARALDLGCGRGEWLELLGEQGYTAHGVDLDLEMLQGCRARGLDAEHGDALARLRAEADASLTLVSGFHLVEHNPFADLQSLVAEAIRVLRPGGLLILETPNPENLVVATSGFYMDPSHLRPLPPALLDFVAEHQGFARRKIVRLQEPVLAADAPLQLMNVFDAASPDYSVVAQKPGDAALEALLDAAFAADYGIDLARLAQRYDQQQAQHRRDLDALVAQRDAGVLEAAAALRREMAGVTAQLANMHAMASALEQAGARAAANEQQIAAMRASTSWVVTRPLRAAGSLARLLRRGVARSRSHGVRGVLLALVRKLVAQPRVRQLAMRVLARMPALDRRLRALARRSMQAAVAPRAPTTRDGLTAPARDVLARLERACGAARPGDIE